MKRIGLILMAIQIMALPVYSQIVAIPNPEFLNALIDRGFDTDGDDLISYSEAEAVTELRIGPVPDWGGLLLDDVTGLEAFVNLDTLSLFVNMYSVDLSAHEKLKFLEIGSSIWWMGPDSGPLAFLNLNSNTELEYLNCSNNQFTSIDLSTNQALKYITLINMPTLVEVCVWESFPSGVVYDIEDSPNVNFTTICEKYGDRVDRFEDNDTLSAASLIPDNYVISDLYVSHHDSDWYKLFFNDDYREYSLIITCDFIHSKGDIDIDLVDGEGNILASSHDKTDNERIDYQADQQESLFLHVYLNSGMVNDYKLYWYHREKIPHCELDICKDEAECDHYIINPAGIDSTIILDTLEVELFAGDESTEIISMHNTGPDQYQFYSVLDCSEIVDSLNHAIKFNGQDGFINIGQNSSYDLEKSLTLEAWIKISQEASNEGPVISKEYSGFGYELYITGDEDKRLGFRIDPDTIYSKSILQNETWYHVAATYDSRVISLFINGIIDIAVYAPGAISKVNQDLLIGTNSNRSPQRYYFNGMLDDIRVWNIARKPREIHAFMHRELTGEETGLIGYWPMNEDNGRQVIDHASDNSGLMVGGSTRSSSPVPIRNLIQWSPDIGYVGIDSLMDYELIFSADDLVSGEYLTDIHIISHDPTKPDLILPTCVNVTDAPSFSIQPDSVLMGEIELYKTYSRDLNVVNHGSQTLYIDSVSSDLIGSEIKPASSIIGPGESVSFHLDLFVRNSEPFSGSLTFYTNDPSDNHVLVPFQGVGTQINEFALLNEIDATMMTGHWKAYYLNLPNNNPLHEFTLYNTSIKTYSIPVESHNNRLQLDTISLNWVYTSFQDTLVIPPGGSEIFVIILDTRNIQSGDYFADIILEWRNPYYNKGYIPIRLHVEDQTGLMERNTRDLLIYPNPTGGLLSIQTYDDGIYDVMVTSLNGQIVYSKRVGGDLLQLNLSAFPKGVYFITIRSKDFVATRKIIKL